MTEATTPATDAELAALKAAAERVPGSPPRWCSGLTLGHFYNLANPSTILALLARLDAAERERDEWADAFDIEHDAHIACQNRAERLAAAARIPRARANEWHARLQSGELPRGLIDAAVARHNVLREAADEIDAALAAERGETGEGGSDGEC